MTATANRVSEDATAADEAPSTAAPRAEPGPFVLNLCSSSTPMALAQADLPELQRFTFFVSRRFEEGRERFRLHMGFFATLAEAEDWLAVVRDIYPGAWAGEAPGKKLRARAAQAAAAQARHAVGPQPKLDAPAARAAVAPADAVRAAAAEPRAATRAMVVPTVHPPMAQSARPATCPATPAAARVTATVAHSAHARVQLPAPGPPRAALQTAAAASARAIPHAPAPAGRAGSASPASPRHAGAPVPRATTAPAPRKPLFSDSNIKEVLAALEGPTEAAPQTPASRRIPQPQPKSADEVTLTDTQVLRFLESRRNEIAPPIVPAAGPSTADSSISLLKPDDTGARRALRAAVSQNEPVWFAVQLQWSPRPVDLETVPPLAIFSAYTLYCIAGSREGRKWYGLRLGFFNDAISAKQVAYYVRSEFTSVAVVPVTTAERERATEDSQRICGTAAPRKRRASEDNEIKLIEDSGVRPTAAPPAVAAADAPARGASPATAPKPPAGARKAAGKVGARERRTPQTLEETLEILGANDLSIDSHTDTLSDTGVRHLRVEVQKNTPFSRLLERLSERVKRS